MIDVRGMAIGNGWVDPINQVCSIFSSLISIRRCPCKGFSVASCWTRCSDVFSRSASSFSSVWRRFRSQSRSCTVTTSSGICAVTWRSGAFSNFPRICLSPVGLAAVRRERLCLWYGADRREPAACDEGEGASVCQVAQVRQIPVSP